MKALVQKLSGHPQYSKIYNWGKLITITGGAQVLVQAIGLFCGILIIRLLPTKEYALYTLANTMMSIMTILADGGVTIGVMSESSKFWNDKKHLGIVLATGFNLRKKLAIASLMVAVPILAYLLLHHGASVITAIFIILSLIPAFLSALSDSLFEVVPKLHQDIKSLQKNQLNVSIGRLLLNVVALFLFPFSFIAVLANAIPRVYGNIQLKKIAAKNANMHERGDNEIKRRIIQIVKLSMPGLIYYCLSGQLNIWLISVFGHTESVATLGALGRLSMVMTLFTSVFGVLVVPRFARLPSDQNILNKAFIKVQMVLYGISAVALVVVYFGSGPILWMLGGNYSSFKTELFLSILSSCIVLLVGGTYTIYSTRGWIMHPIQSISVSIVSVITGVLLFDVSSLRGVLFMNIFVAIIEYINHLLYAFTKINKIKATPRNT